MPYIIGSGWWCSESDDNRDKLYGNDLIRGVSFHEQWYQSIKKNSTPTQIYIVDSNSPIKPNFKDDVIFVTLNENGGHATNLNGKYCGWMRSVLHSMSYAQNCECEYFVYVEQDVLLHGKNIIENCIAQMTKPFMFGKCNDYKNPLQQSFFIIKKDHIDIFLSRIFRITYSDNIISPEKKFALATSPLFPLIPKFLFAKTQFKSKLLNRIIWRLQNIASKCLGSYNYLPYGFGRDRPIDMSNEYFYFQHGTSGELDAFFNKKN